jgi:hypothetical protein
MKGPHPGINSPSLLSLQLEVSINRDVQNIKEPEWKLSEYVERKKGKSCAHKRAGLLPIFWKISAWVWTCRTLNGQATRRRTSNTLRVMSTPCTFERHKVSPNPEDPMDLFVAILGSNSMSSRDSASKVTNSLTMVSETFALSVFRSRR